MRTKAMLAGLLVLGFVVIGCGTPMVPGATVTEDGTYLFSAEGTSPVLKADDAMSLLEAKVAAATIAKANLIEKIKGAAIDSMVRTEDLAFARQAASTNAAGLLARATVTYLPSDRTGREAMLVTAVASLELTPEQYRKDLAAYAE